MSEIRHFDTCFIEMLCACVRECFPRREMMLWLLGFICDYLRDQREKLGFLLCRLIEYSYVIILPQISQIHADKRPTA